MLHSGACSFRILPLPSRQTAITHSGVAVFRFAPFTDLKGEVFLSQLNLTEVSKVNNKMGHAALKALEPNRGKKKKRVVITKPVKGMKWNMFSTHIKTAFTPKSLCNISVKYKVIPSGLSSGNHVELYFPSLWSSRLNKWDKCWSSPIKQTLLQRFKAKWECDLCHNLKFCRSRNESIYWFLLNKIPLQG